MWAGIRQEDDSFSITNRKITLRALPGQQLVKKPSLAQECIIIENKEAAGDRWTGKINFVEICTFWHIFRSFNRMWSFFILCLQVITLDMGLLVAGTKYRGEFEERLKKLMEEIKQSDEIILFIDETKKRFISKLSKLLAGVPNGNCNHLSAVSKLHEYWFNGQNAVVIDDQVMQSDQI
ncbi:hypothetical protein LOK49_LG08G02408 [Camellia lanceoleosa]|uniref:Uncharacterized protein n=1 Tax=Camellia lanceoleosa TaxID=1840588 RepID=A0ACC0GT20_9ERIC|nr:hypothetical protein LOK49_LG08G02408 [Camellia lanceoleosa]